MQNLNIKFRLWLLSNWKRMVNSSFHLQLIFHIIKLRLNTLTVMEEWWDILKKLSYEKRVSWAMTGGSSKKVCCILRVRIIIPSFSIGGCCESWVFKIICGDYWRCGSECVILHVTRNVVNMVRRFFDKRFDIIRGNEMWCHVAAVIWYYSGFLLPWIFLILPISFSRHCLLHCNGHGNVRLMVVARRWCIWNM